MQDAGDDDVLWQPGPLEQPRDVNRMRDVGELGALAHLACMADGRYPERKIDARREKSHFYRFLRRDYTTETRTSSLMRSDSTPIILPTMLSGARIGAFEVVSLLGKGGMGEVYRARDARLNRDVAVKILPAAFASDPDRLARFKREAQVLASLNHPNIAAIYGFEETDGVLALVLELVEGPTLADRIAAGASGAGRGAADRQADCRRARMRAHAGHRPSRPEAGQHQSEAGRHGEGARLRPGEGVDR